VSRVLEALAGAGLFKVTRADGFVDRRVSIQLDDATIKQSLQQLATLTGIEYKVPGSKELVVSSPAGK